MNTSIDKRELEKIIISVIKTVYDPEIPVDIYELGLIYTIFIDDEYNVLIDMTLTSPACPVAETLPAEVEMKVGGVQGVTSAKVNITFNPPWTRDMMSEVAQLELGMM